MISEFYLSRLKRGLEELSKRLPRTDGVLMNEPGSSFYQQADQMLENLVERLQDHYPFHQPFYAGQMIKPPHPVAWLAYALGMSINPNNHALDGGPAASVLEKEVMVELRNMTGFPKESLGHLTSSGTIANLEALWVARELHPDRPVAITPQSHYTHRRMCSVLRIPVVELPLAENGQPDPAWLKDKTPLPGTLVVTMGTTGLGRVEPLHELLGWARNNGVRIHVDAAYGGFFALLRKTGLIEADPWNVLHEADSLVIDPHKHGLQPYGCGSVLLRDPRVGRFYRHDSPYTYFTSDQLHLGEISLECSRPGSSAIALWATLKMFPLNLAEGQDGRQGEEGLAEILVSCRKAALDCYSQIKETETFEALIYPELDIIAFYPRVKDKTYSGVSRKTLAILNRGMSMNADQALYLSMLELDRDTAMRLMPGLIADAPGIKILRSVLMKPSHLAFIPEMIRRLEELYRHT